MKARALPSVDAVLSTAAGRELCERLARPLVVDAIRAELGRLREALGREGDRRAEAPAPERLRPDAIARAAGDRARREADPALPRVVNATGVLLHTSLGRAPLASAAIEAAAAAAAEPCALELDLASGRRGERDRSVASLLRALTGAEDALVVNNNAAALLLVLETLASRREVVVSRGELIEIGGSFRLPELLERSGAILREVGTTNRTHLGDFEAAIGRRTALVLRTHPSNFRIVGFTAAPSRRELATLAHERGVPLVEDLGSGALVPLERFGLGHEPTPAEALADGADLVTFSGDKLLGGPQAGLVVGRRELVERLRRSPLKRALRAGKLTLAALRATLALYRASPDPATDVPILRLLGRSPGELEELAERAAAGLRTALGDGFEVSVVESEAEVGGGAQPTARLASRAVAVARPGWPVERVAARFREARTPILGRIAHGRLLLDVCAIGRPEDLVPEAPDAGASPEESG